jgi:hypothetical protein
MTIYISGPDGKPMAFASEADWMWRLGIPPVPMWAVGWFFDVKDWLMRARHRR